MALRPAFSPSCTLSVHKSFLKGLDVQPGLLFDKPGVCIQKSPVKLRHHLVTEGLKTQELEDSTLVDMQESSNGYVLFKFGTTQLYDNPPRFISSSVAAAKPMTYTDADREVIDCTAVVCRMPEESSVVSPFRWGYGTASLHGDANNDYDNRGPSLKLPTTSFVPRKPVHLPVDFLQSLRSGNLADYVVDKGPVLGKESVADFLPLPSSSNVEMLKVSPANLTLEDGSTRLTTLSTKVIQSMKSSTVKRADKVGKKARSGHKKPTRDLYRSSSFQLYELIFSYPFADMSKSTSTWKAIPKEKYVELLEVLNQVAVGLAGSGLAIVLFVASRMLCVNATLDSLKFMSLLRGVGLLWLSSAVQKLGAMVRIVAESSCKGKPERKEHLAMLRKEVHSVTFKVCTMVMLSMVRLA